MPERDALGWARDILIVLILLAILAGIITAILNINSLFNAISSLTGQNGNRNYQNQGNNQNYGSGNNQSYNSQNNYQQNSNQSGYQQNNNQSSYQQNNSQSQQAQALSDMAVSLKNAVDTGDWGTADSILRVVDSMSSQLPQEVQSLLPQFDQAVRNRDKTAFDALYAQVSSPSQNNQNYS
jgi:hypothetical protein